jgi:hypothetical protein
MRQVIDGRVFDTDTATEICRAAYGGSRTDFQWHETALYRSPRGQFFLAGQGGPMSRWAQDVDGGGRSGGSGIVLLTQDEAREFMERQGCDVEAFERAGLPVEEG